MGNKCLKMLSLCLLLTLLVGSMAPGLAAKKPWIYNRVLWVGMGKYSLTLRDIPSNAKSFAIKSQDKTVIKVGCTDINDPYGLWVKPLKPGFSMITVTYKSGGKKYTLKSLFKVRKYTCPFAWLKVNGKKVNLSKNKYTADFRKYKKDKINVSFKLNSGWKVGTCEGGLFKGDDFTHLKWKNGKNIDLSGYDSAVVAMTINDKKTNDEFVYQMLFER